MRHTNKKTAGVLTLAAVASMFQSGCAGGMSQASPSQAYARMVAPNASYGSPYNAASAAGAPSYPVPDYSQQQRLESTAMELKERLERVEKAMLRLDRRMQLVERNELHRMSGTDGGTPVAAITPSEEKAAMTAMDIGPATPRQQEEAIATRMVNDYHGGVFRQVSGDATIRSTLQAAPPRQLASLADNASPAAGRAPGAAADVAVWTIRYQSDKVWPEREQLPLSREVVEALRASPNATLFARGPNPNAVQFRERVKALSRYLSKVTSLETVPIAALPSPQLDANTIEILATY